MVDVSTKPGKGLMWLVPDRKASTLIPLIMDNVINGTIIHSDQWSAYRQLSTKTNITYKTVNHSQHFVDPITRVHTQAIERYWSKTKYQFKKMKGVLHEKLPGYLDERMWRDRYGGTTEEAYTNILKHIGLIYVLSTPSPIPSSTPSPTPSPMSSPTPSPIITQRKIYYEEDITCLR